MTKTSFAVFASTVLVCSTFLATDILAEEQAELSWKDKFEIQLKQLGDGNCIVVADAAFPHLSANGIDLLVANKSLIKVLQYVIEEIEDSDHVCAKITTEAELNGISETELRGIDKYRKALTSATKRYEVSTIAHDNMMAQILQVAAAKRVLIVKSETTLPYSAVMLALERPSLRTSQGEQPVAPVVEPEDTQE